MGDIVVGQQGIKIVGGEKQFLVAFVIADDVAEVGLDDGSFCELVVGTDEQAHGIDDQTNGAGGIEPEGLIGNNSHLWHLLHEILCD